MANEEKTLQSTPAQGGASTNSNVTKTGVLGNFGVVELATLGCLAYASASAFIKYKDNVVGAMIAVPGLLSLNKAAGDKSDFGDGDKPKFSFKNFSVTELLSVAAIGYGAYKLYDQYGAIYPAIAAAVGGLSMLYYSSLSDSSTTL